MSGYVGRPPGTTTLRLGNVGSPWGPGYAWLPQRHMPPGATIVGGSNAPHDFELAKYWNYTPVQQGWMVGHLGPVGGELSGLSQDKQEEIIEEQLKTLRWNRIWSGVGALAAVGALLISFAALNRSRR